MRVALKRIANLVAVLLVLPAVLLFRATALAIGPEAAFPGWSQAFSLVPGLCGVYLRRGFYRLVLRRFAGDASIHFGTIRRAPTPGSGVGSMSGSTASSVTSCWKMTYWLLFMCRY